MRSADELLRKVDEYLLSVVAAGVRPEPVDAPAVTRVLYGRKANADLTASIAGFLAGLPASPSPA